jgi:hypothetical protein
MTTLKLTKTGSPKKWLYKVIDEDGQILAKRSSSRDYVAAFICYNTTTGVGDILHAFGREDLVSAGIAKYDFTPGEIENMREGGFVTPVSGSRMYGVAYLKADETINNTTPTANEPAENSSTFDVLRQAERLGEITDDARRFTALQEILLNVGLFGSSETWGPDISLKILRNAIRNFNLPQTPIEDELAPDLSESMVLSDQLSNEVNVEAERLYNLYLLQCGNKRLSSDLIMSRDTFISSVIDGLPVASCGLWFQLYKEPTTSSPFAKKTIDLIYKRRQTLLEDLRYLSTNGELHDLID